MGYGQRPKTPHFSHPPTMDYQSCKLHMSYMTNGSTVFIYCTNFGHNWSQFGLPSQVSVTKEFLVTIAITMLVATDIATTFQLR